MKQVEDDKDLYAGLIRLHILYQASRGPVFGQAIMDALGRNGYKLAAGTLYPVLHSLEKKNYLHLSAQDGHRDASTVSRL
jgi:DNA-binding PadR family transcriptional regulator